MRYVIAAYSRVPPSSSAAFGIGTAKTVTAITANMIMNTQTLFVFIPNSYFLISNS